MVNNTQHVELPHLLVVDDSATFLRSLSRWLRDEFQVVTASTPDEALRLLLGPLELALLDVRFSDDDIDDRTGIELLKAFKELRPDLPVVIMSAHGDIPMAVEAMQLGAANYLEKQRMTDDIGKLRSFLRDVVVRSRRTRRSAQLEEDLARLEPWTVVGESAAMKDVKHAIDMVAQDAYTTVLLRGETGTGKEVAARAIWRRGKRSSAPFVPVNLASQSPQMIESDLFGHERGAFTGAHERRIGFIEKADGGILFLDEIGDLSNELQVKLLRFLEDRSFTRLGSTAAIGVNVQVIAATNVDLEQAIEERKFRSDLYYRLKACQIVLPPLREHPSDIPLLANHFLSLVRSQGRTKVCEITPEAMNELCTYIWPGNIRELRNTIDSAITFKQKDEQRIEAIDWRRVLGPLEKVIPAGQLQSHEARSGADDLSLTVAKSELQVIEAALDASDGKKSKAGIQLGLNDRYALLRRVNKLIKDHPELIDSFPLIAKLYRK